MSNNSTKHEASNNNISKFILSEYNNPEISITIGENDTLTFYIEPSSIKTDKISIEVVNSDVTVAKCLLQDVRAVNGKKLAIVSYRGMNEGETTLYLKDIRSDVKSQEIHITVNQKVEEIDNSRTVYLNYGGEKYHYSQSCAGKSAYKSTLNQAKKLSKKPCGNCVH